MPCFKYLICAHTEGDAYFTVKLQDYTAVEKDEVTLDCELSKDVPVKWFHNETEIKASKMVSMKVDGKRRILCIKKVEDKDKGQYACDCGTDKTAATVTIEGTLVHCNVFLGVLLMCVLNNDAFFQLVTSKLCVPCTALSSLMARPLVLRWKSQRMMSMASGS